MAITYEEILEHATPFERATLLKMEKRFGKKFMLNAISLGVARALGDDVDNIPDDGNARERQEPAYGCESQMETETESSDDM